MNGRGQIIALVVVGVSLGGLILNGQRLTNSAIGELRIEVADVRNEVAVLRTEVHADIADLRERMARLEGLFEGHLNREGP